MTRRVAIEIGRITWFMGNTIYYSLRIRLGLVVLLMLTGILNVSLHAQRGVPAEGKSGMRLFRKLQGEKPYLILVDEPVEADAKRWLHQVLEVGQGHTFELRSSTKPDRYGFTSILFDQYYRGVRVEDGRYRVMLMAGKPVQAVGQFFHRLPGNLSGHVSKRSAKKEAFAQYRKHFSLPTTAGVRLIAKGRAEKLVLTLGDSARFAWCFDVEQAIGREPQRVCIDATTGVLLQMESLEEFSNTPGIVQTQSYGQKSFETHQVNPGLFLLKDENRNIEVRNLTYGNDDAGVSIYNDNDNFWDDTLDQERAAATSLWVAQQIYDYLAQQQQYIGLDGNGAGLMINHNGNPSSAMSYSNGAINVAMPTNGITTWATIDLLAHEYMHALIEAGSALNSGNQSGPIKEAICDIFGIYMEYLLDPAGADYLIAEEARPSMVPFRNHEDPLSLNLPVRYLGQHYVVGSSNDQRNATVMGHWFYLVAEGGSGVDALGFPYQINGIGIDSAFQLVYRLQSLYLQPGSTFVDALQFSLLVAEQMYGQCSPIISMVSEAWRVVGVSSDQLIVPMQPQANFIIDRLNNCINPPQFKFLNASSGDLDLQWDFGDGNTSIDDSPIHTYDSVANYQVTLITFGNEVCSQNDTLTQPLYVSTAILEELPSVCAVSNTNSSNSQWFTQFKMGGDQNLLDATSNLAYVDYTCEKVIEVYPGDWVKYISQGNSSSSTRLWTDLNNDGVFSDTEQFSPVSTLNSVSDSGYVYIPSDVSLPGSFRLRARKVQSSLNNSPCNSYFAGQAIDFRVEVLAPNAAPEARFDANVREVVAGMNVQFQCFSEGGIVGREWHFEGGVPAVSTSGTPLVNYPQPGVFPVYLKVSNAFGEDSLYLDHFIRVNPVNVLCTNSGSLERTGYLCDPAGVLPITYGPGTCSFTLAPTCSDSIAVRLISGTTNFLRISPGSVYSVSNNQLIGSSWIGISNKKATIFYSASSTGSRDFLVEWKSFQSDTPFVAVEPEILLSDSVINIGDMLYASEITDESYFGKRWLLNGAELQIDGELALQPSIAGNYLISFEYLNCEDETISVNRELLVLQDANYTLSTQSLSYTGQCLQDTSLSIVIENQGSEELDWAIAGLQNEGSELNIVALTNNVSTSYLNAFRNFVDQELPDATLSEISDVSAPSISLALSTADVVFIPPSNLSNANYSSVVYALLTDFVEQGGRLIDASGEEAILDSLGFFNGNKSSVFSTGVLLNPSALPYVEGLELSNIFPNGSLLVNRYILTNEPEAFPMNIANSQNTIFYYKNIGLGRAFLWGLENLNVTSYLNDLFGRVFSIPHLAMFPEGVSVNANTGTIPPGANDTLVVELNDLIAGNYQFDLPVVFNQNFDQTENIPVQLFIQGEAEMNLSAQSVLLTNVPAYSTVSQTKYIYNTGCDTLMIDSLVCSSAAFSAEVYANMVLPGDTVAFSISSMPVAAGQYSGILTVYSSANTVSIPLLLNSVSNNGLVLSNDTVSVALNSCSGSFSFPLTLSNNSNSPLDVIVEQVQVLSDQLRVGIFSSGADMAVEVPNIISILESITDNIFISTTVTSATINDFDFVIIPYVSSLSSFDSEFFFNFVQGGGKVILLAQSSTNTMVSFSLIPAVTTSAVNLNSNNSVVLPSILTEGLPSTINLSNSTRGINVWENSTYQSFIQTPAGNSYLGIQSLGRGEVIYLGNDFNVYNSNDSRILKNSVKYFSNKLPNQFTFSSDSLALAANTQQEIQVTVSSEGLPAGDYLFHVIVSDQNSSLNFDTLVVEISVSGPPCADFTYVQNCYNQFEFFSNPLNDFNCTYIWSFTPAGNSNSRNTSRTLQQGSQLVTLSVCNSEGCRVQTQQIQVDAPFSMAAASCTATPDVGMGSILMRSVKIAEREYPEFLSIEGYRDYTCDAPILASANSQLPFLIRTNSSALISMWIDLNNDGLFNQTSERVLATQSSSTASAGSITIPNQNIQFNTPLRMRILCHSQNAAIFSSCQDVNSGQYVDFRIVISDTNSLGELDFVGSPSVVLPGDLVNFTNLSEFEGITNVQWIFEGAVPSSSTFSAPIVTYPNIGTYDVTLILTNNSGSDTLIKYDYIEVTNAQNMCVDDSTTNPFGYLYDSGGPTGNYQINSDCSFLIRSSCADSIRLFFEEWAVETCCDYIFVYDGVNSSAPLLLTTQLLNISPGYSIAGSSGSLFIRFTSDVSVVSSGFRIRWESVLFEEVIENPGFTVSDSTPAILQPVSFSPQNLPIGGNYFWDFGDGNQSDDYSPVHAYTNAGTYIVTLNAQACSPDLFITDTIVVAGNATLNISENVEILRGCSSTSDELIQIQNSGNELGTWEFLSKTYSEPLNIGFYTLSVTPFMNTLMDSLSDYMNSTYSNIQAYSFSSTNLNTLNNRLDTTDVLFLSPVDAFTWTPGIYSVFNQFIEDGGTVIQIGGEFALMETFMNVSLSSIGVSGEFLVNPSSPLSMEFPASLNLTSMRLLSSTDEEVIPLLYTNQGYASFFKPFGNGGFHYLGINNAYNNSLFQWMSELALYNKFNGPLSPPSWLSFSESSGTIAAGDSVEINLNTSLVGLAPGEYIFNLFIRNNDVSKQLYPLQIRLLNDVQPCPDFTFGLSCSNGLTLLNTSIRCDSLSWFVNGIGPFTGDSLVFADPGIGQFTVQIIGCNEFGCYSITEVNSIPSEYDGSQFACIPDNSGTPVSNFLTQFISVSEELNTESAIMANAQYNDYSCSNVHFFKQNTPSTVELLFNQPLFYALYFDLNANQQFDSNEFIVSGFGASINYGLFIDNSAVTDSLFKIRLLVDNNSPVLSACESPNGGAVFDLVGIVLSENSSPVANWNYNTVNCSSTIQFNSTSVLASSYLWDFGDGNSSTSENPLHTYSNPGSYTVGLTIENAQGVSSTFAQVIEVVEIDPLNIQISGLGVVGNAIQFETNNDYISYFWEFSDGQTSAESSPVMLFDAEGQYTISLTVSNGLCALSTDTTFQILLIDSTLTANFNFYQNDCGAEVSFLNFSTNAYLYSWDFGGGNTSTAVNPQFTFSGPGSYPVTLTAFGSFDTVMVTRIVHVADFDDQIDIYPTQVPLNYAFELGNTYDAYEWSINGTMFSFGSWFTNTFSQAGTYTVVVRVVKFGCQYEFSSVLSIVIDGIDDPMVIHQVNLYPNPAHENAVLEWSSSVVEPMQVSMFDVTGRLLSTNHVESLGNGKFRSLLQTQHVAGVYLVELRVGDTKRVLKLVVN